jgi:hypothetical protein
MEPRSFTMEVTREPEPRKTPNTHRKDIAKHSANQRADFDLPEALGRDY